MKFLIVRWENISNRIQNGILHALYTGAQKDIDPANEEYQIAKYMISVLYENLSKFIITGIIAVMLGIFKYYLFFAVCYGWLRVLAYGVHLKNSLQCLIAGTITYYGSIYASLYLAHFSWFDLHLIYVAAFVICFFIYGRYAPAVPTGQFLKKGRDKKLKQKVLILLTALFFLQFFLPKIYRLLLVFAVVAEAINIHPLNFYLWGGDINGEVETSDC